MKFKLVAFALFAASIQGCAINAYDGPTRAPSDVATLVPGKANAEAVRHGRMLIGLIPTIVAVDDHRGFFMPSKVNVLPGSHWVTANCRNGQVTVDSDVNALQRAFVVGWIGMGNISYTAEPSVEASLEAGHLYSVECFPAPYSFTDGAPRVKARVVDQGTNGTAAQSGAMSTPGEPESQAE
jgi:hypothetical protein